MRRGYQITKRTIDIVASAAALVITAPVQAGVAVAIARKLGRPVLFRQQRPGKDGKPFTLLKFRTMLPIDQSRGCVDNEQRMTALGRILRSSSLDELPSLWNILVGDMSLIGPRPLRESYLDRYSAEQRRRHEVRPGLTGLAQVKGRNSLGWDERLALDVSYVDNCGPLLDLRVILLTVGSVLFARGISAEGEATMSEFYGPEKTSRLRLVELADVHLQKRVDLLSDPLIRAGISITFEPDIASMREWFTRTKKDRSRADWAGVDSAGRVVSMCGIQRQGDGSASLYIYVDPARHREGIGRDTMCLLMAQARRAGVIVLTLETSDANIAANSLYSSLGFKTAARTASGDKVVMMKDIRAGHRDG